MDFRLLGPLEVHEAGTRLQISGGKQRALLALLLLNANRTLSRDQILDSLWAEHVPESAPKMVQIYVSQLRKELPEPRLQTQPPGYALHVAEDELDLVRFERLVAEGRQALAQRDAAAAGELLRQALSLWRGPALAEFDEPFAAHEIARLEELRINALEWRLEADLALGRHRDAVGELEALVAQHPLRERLRSQYMLSLYRSGRHAEALAAYQAFRRTLSDELGIEPPASLRELERLMLRQDPSLEAPSPVAAGPPGDVAYARSGDIRIAYQIVGGGPLDLVLVHGWVCTFQPGWENPKLAGFYRRLASIGRLILFDKRGTGLSDRVSPDRLPDLETRMDDVRAVLDAAGSERAVIIGVSEGAAMSTLFAATYPERTVALVLVGAFARAMQAPDYPIGTTEEAMRARLIAGDDDDWASAVTKEWLARVGPDIVRDPATLRWYTSYLLRGASPAANKAIRLMNAAIDVRDVLPTISVPTLVMHRADEYFNEASRYMAARIPGARLRELPGNDHIPWEGDAALLLDELERFLAGVREEAEPDRVLATVLFAELDEPAAWARAQVARFRGHEIDSGGRGLLATFDGPARAVRCASAIVAAAGELGVEARAGVHTGEIERTGDTARGVAVEAVRQLARGAPPGGVLVSGTVKDITAGSGIEFEERGERVFAPAS
ncbi:MAG TPA: alpha/beta fold hydrolase [Gaiellaceae bacterium]|nr:alpha/beta fold hydrolase [Gaiellaceae bacterium]